MGCPAIDCCHELHWGLKCPERGCGCIGIPSGLTLAQAEQWSRETGATEPQVQEAVAAYQIAIQNNVSELKVEGETQ